jgi:hypothetical protein
MAGGRYTPGLVLSIFINSTYVDSVSYFRTGILLLVILFTYAMYRNTYVNVSQHIKALDRGPRDIHRMAVQVRGGPSR